MSKKTVWATIRLLVIFGCLVFFCLSLCGCMNENNIPEDASSRLEYSENPDGSYTVTGIGQCKDKNIVIPSAHNGSPVTAISANAFATQQSIVSVVVPDSVKTIGKAVFFGCDNLKSLSLPFIGASESDTEHAYIGYLFGASRGKSISASLTTLTVKSAPSLGDYALYGLRNLRSFTIPSDTVTIGEHCFEGCQHLSEMQIPSAVTSVGFHAFNGCSRLTRLDILCPGDALQNDSLYGLSALKDLKAFMRQNSASQNSFLYVFDSQQAEEYFSKMAHAGMASPGKILPRSLVNLTVYGHTIPANAFCGACYLEAVHFADTVTCISDGAFASCRRLTVIDFPREIQTIGKYAFASCTALINLSLPDSLVAISDNAFDSCLNLAQLTVPAKVSSIGMDAFSNNTSLVKVRFTKNSQSPEELIIGQQCFEGCTKLTDILFTAHIKRLETGLFQGCTALKTVSVPSNITYIGVEVFDGCSSLTSLTFDRPNGWKTVNGYARPVLDDPIQNVTYFTNTYVSYYWTR